MKITVACTFLIAFMLNSAFIFAGEEDGKALLENAKARLAQVEKELSLQRQSQLEERKKIAAELQDAYAELNAARARAQKAHEDYSSLVESRNEIRRNDASYRFKCKILKSQ
ncbi:MAG: hypothetical protein JXR97_13550, partial [Planctomycetes bacterium]|nr:hypothetical protein [Planctomycetota bacterium]